MGNVVIMAVRHRQLDQVAKYTLNDICHQMHQSDRYIKTFSTSEKWVDGRYADEEVENIIFSQYYHASGTLDAYIDGDMMVSCDFSRFNEDAGYNRTLFNFEDGLKHARRILRHKKMSLHKSQKASRKPKNSDKVSLFLLYTDTLHDIDRNPHVMPAVARYCETGEISKIFGGINQGIKVIGTLDQDEAAIVLVKDYQPQIQIMPRYELNFSTEERQAANAAEGEGSYAKACDLCENAFLREFAGANGYLLRSAKA